MGHPGGITDSEVLRAVLAGAPVRVAVVDRSGRFLLDPDPNPPLTSDIGAPAGRHLLDVYDGEGPCVFLAKPFTPVDLAEKLAQALR